MKILVGSVAPGSLPEPVNCSSYHAFLVYGVTNGRSGYSINARSPG